MNYKEALQYIEEKNKLGIVPGLDNIKELLKRLGNPEARCKALHIAGTNGKGSIFAFVESALIEAGYKIGRYISPTIFTYLERFQINKKYMDEETFARLLETVAGKISEMEEDGYSSPTAFEIETVIAFLFFTEEKCDYMLIECGMGGTLDATNVIPAPVASVFAQISMDHMQFLGETLEEITKNKSGIIKEGSACISAPQNREVSKVLKSVCADKEDDYTEVKNKDIKVISEGENGISFNYKNNDYFIKLLGEHQIINAATAIETLKKLDIDEQYIKNGLAKTTWQGRLTRVCESPLVYVDGAHNEAAWNTLRNNINKYFTNKRIIYIIGVLKDKEYQKMVDILCNNMEYAITITPDTPRGLDKKILAGLIEKKGVKTDMAETADEALKKAFSYVGEDKMDCVIMVCGSLSFIADYLNMKFE
ncbi:MAG: bifunctional folylpolyglutamate synthase/dihydrofolate synthase [Lachnospiraceae bacterium]|nr:bifunctional folylpolyglutamate synthase/dihydrofolate synthase [Lachnospiraceae bacterium]